MHERKRNAESDDETKSESNQVKKDAKTIGMEYLNLLRENRAKRIEHHDTKGDEVKTLDVVNQSIKSVHGKSQRSYRSEVNRETLM